MTIKEIRERQDEALRHELADRQKHLFDLRSQAVTEKLEDPSQLLKTRKDIARMKTVLRQRQLEAQRPTTEPAARQEPPKSKRPKKTWAKKAVASETKA